MHYRAAISRCGSVALCLPSLLSGWDERYDESHLASLRAIIPSVDLVLITHPDLAHLGALPYAVGKLGLVAPIMATLPVWRMGQVRHRASRATELGCAAPPPVMLMFCFGACDVCLLSDVHVHRLDGAVG